jgi:hypothetical protein
VDINPGIVRTTGPCISADDPATPYKEYTCLKGQNIQIQVTIKNIGDYDIKIKSKPNIFAGSIIPTMTATEATITKGQTSQIGATFILVNTANTVYSIWPGAECTDLICKNNPDLESKSLSAETNKIQITTVDKIN